MPLEHAGGNPVHVLTARDVADLVLAVELLRELAQALLAAREEDAAPAVLREPARERRADPARCACDDR